MDIETITKLLDAGYTKTEIDAMQEPKPEGKKDDEEPKTDPKPEGDAGAPDGGEVDNPDLSEVVKTLSETVNGLTATVKAMQDKNAGKAATDKAKKDTVEDVMKSFIDTL